MATFEVISVGLFGILRRAEDVQLLLRKAKKGEEHDPHGHSIPEHESAIKFYSKGKKQVIDLNGETVRIGSGNAPVVGDFLKVSDLFDFRPNLNIKYDKLAGLIEFKGGKVVPVGIDEVTGDYQYGDILWRAVGRFSYYSSKSGVFSMSKVANGALWTMRVDKAPVLVIKDIEYTLDLSGDKYIVWIENASHNHYEPGPAVDRHFSLLYKFFNPEPEIWVPLIQSLRKVPLVSPPGSQCIPPLLE